MKTPRELEVEEQEGSILNSEVYVDGIREALEKSVCEAIKSGRLCSNGGECVYKAEVCESTAYEPLSATELSIVFAHLKKHSWDCKYKLCGARNVCIHKLILVPVIK